MPLSVHGCIANPAIFAGGNISNFAPGALVFDFIPDIGQQALGHIEQYEQNNQGKH
jgi:hypothetical protein